MSYLLPDCPSFIYLFSFKVHNKGKREGLKELKSVEKRCRLFAESLQIHFHTDCYFYFPMEKESSCRLVFNIKEPENSVLVKVPVLFGFAACLNLAFINQAP